MSSTADLIARRRSRILSAAGITDPYRVVVKRVDGTRKIYEFRTYTVASRLFLTAWRKTRTGQNPTGYTVALEEHDGTSWCPIRCTSPNERQIRARHAYLAATLS